MRGIEILVQSEKRCASKPVQNRNQVFVLDAQADDFHADNPTGDSQLRSCATWNAGRFSSMMTIQFPSAQFLNQSAGQGSGFSNRRLRYAPPPLLNNLVPSHSISQLLQHDPNQHACALESGRGRSRGRRRYVRPTPSARLADALLPSCRPETMAYSQPLPRTLPKSRDPLPPRF